MVNSLVLDMPAMYGIKNTIVRQFVLARGGGNQPMVIVKEEKDEKR